MRVDDIPSIRSALPSGPRNVGIETTTRSESAIISAHSSSVGPRRVGASGDAERCGASPITRRAFSIRTSSAVTPSSASAFDESEGRRSRSRLPLSVPERAGMSSPRRRSAFGGARADEPRSFCAFFGGEFCGIIVATRAERAAQFVGFAK